MTPAESFDDVAGIYDAARPSYPAAAVAWLVGDDARAVVDVGAGTGKFTALVRAPGRQVIAVEPSAAMRAELRRRLADVDVRDGTGERMPLPDASADVVTFAQAWHWVDVPEASAEAARVLRPGGILGLVWNLRDERVPWVHALGVAMRADGDHYRGVDDDPLVAPPFGPFERAYFAWFHETSREGVIETVRSRSYFARLSGDEQADVLARVERVLTRHRVAEGDVVRLPFVTAAFRFPRP